MHATFGSGTVDVTIPTRSWRGRSADIQLANGTMNVQLPLNLNAEIDATQFCAPGKSKILSPSSNRATRNVKFTEKSISAKAGNGGVPLSIYGRRRNIKNSDGKQNITQ